MCALMCALGCTLLASVPAIIVSPFPGVSYKNISTRTDVSGI